MLGGSLTQLASGLCSLFLFGQFRSQDSLLVPQNEIPLTTPPQLPIVSLTLAPYLGNESSFIDVTMYLYTGPLARGTEFLSMTLNTPGFPFEVNDYSGKNSIAAFDSQGSLELIWYDRPERGHRTWYLGRDTDGKEAIRLEFRAWPRKITSRTRAGPRFDLREDQGGLIGTGLSFIPELEFLRDGEQLDLVVNWDVSRLHSGSEAIWTYGDGRYVRRIGTRSMLTRSIYMVGPARSVTSSITIPGREHNVDFGIYWFGNSPFDMEDLTSRLELLYQGMATFFNVSEDVYKIFIRRSTARSFGGTAAQSAFVLEYYDGVFEMTDINVDSAFDTLAHEMVHNWPHMDRCSDNDGRNSMRTWFVEGIAVYYAAILPYRFRLIDQYQFRDVVNRNAQAYYTSPLVTDSMDTIQTLTWQSFHAQRVPYYRGFMYLVTLDAELRQKTCGRVSIDDLVLNLIDRQHRGLSYGPQDFLHILDVHLGEGGLKEFEQMMRGDSLIIPPANSLAGLRLNCTTRLPQFELGFDESSVHEEAIVGLVPGSSAEKAGILDGDVVEDAGLYSWVADDHRRKMRLRLQRGGTILNVEYLSRGEMMVDACQWELDH